MSAAPIPVLRTRLVPIFLQRAKALDLDVRDLLRAFELPSDAAVATEISMGLTAFRAFSAELAVRARDDLFGFHTALESKRGDFGLLEYVLRNTPTARDALERLARYGRTINAQVEVSVDPETGRMIERIPGFPDCLGLQGNEFAVAHKVKIARELIGPGFVPTTVFFAHPPRANGPQRRELEDYFRGTTIVYRAEHNGLELPAAALGKVFENADPALLDVLEQRLREASKVGVAEDRLAQLRRAVAEELSASDASGDSLAARLGVSRRTLHRRLAAAGVTLRELVDDVRREMALVYLADPGLELREIATRLGYSDARAFTRAFQRWKGVTPASWRRQA